MILLLALALALPALPQTTQESGQQSSTSTDQSKKGKKKSDDKSTAPEGATAKMQGWYIQLFQASSGNLLPSWRRGAVAEQ